MNNSRETKLKAVKEHVIDGLTIREVSEKYHIDTARLKFLIALYMRYGDTPFLKSSSGRQVFTREQKLEMIKRNLNGESAYSLALELGSTDQTVVRDWVHLYEKHGEEAIKSTKSRTNYVLKDERSQIKAHQRILKRNEYLEAENEVLKKWYTLILQRSEQSKKR